MRREEHEARCREFFGDGFGEVHAFLDQYAFATDRAKETGQPDFAHRGILHNPEGVEQCVQIYGEIARCPALLHLYDDYEYFNYYDQQGHKIVPVADRILAECDAIERQEDFDDGIMLEKWKKNDD